jgi:hypothetical protein
MTASSMSVADAGKAQLDEAARVKRARLEGWIDEQVRALPKLDAKGRAAAAQRLRDDVVKDAAATLLLRIVYLRLLEASGLSAPKVVTGGWDSRGYKDFREAAPELVRADETEGYAALLQLVFEELALELPGLYGPVRMAELVPVPAATLRHVVDALDDDELADRCWTDDMTLGWVYQYWNDPEREALDAKLNGGGKVEPTRSPARRRCSPSATWSTGCCRTASAPCGWPCARSTAGPRGREPTGCWRGSRAPHRVASAARAARMRAGLQLTR